MTEVKLEKVSKHFGETKAVDNVNLQINDGEFMVLLGPSGCGKTTTLRLIAGLEKPTSGLILFDGEVVNDLEPKDRRIAMVFQDYALYPHMKVFDNMALNLQIRGVPKEEIKRKVLETAELLGIKHLLDRKPGQLSGGEQQRVALGRAIIREPSVFLMDEPLSNLDAALRAKMRGELKKLQERLKTTTIYVTHDQVEAMVMADKIAVMKSGKVQQIGSPQEIYSRPANRFVAEFVGSPKMNIFDATLVIDESPRLTTGSFEIKIPPYSVEAVAQRGAATELLVGVRPEDIAVSTAPRRDFIEASVYLVEDIGNLTFVTLQIGDMLLVAQAPPSVGLKEGDKAYFKLLDEKIHLFDKRSEELVV
ncbi:MAG: ABC transporter ATP-binding protein [Nitrososphaerota archaeon]|nr:ABC transporter ATP-binding protein [Candidatus Calditenuaceae archaeon]MDW8073469.1 ABC transporter ATP-binding protein [Nitrososphaerota archaeon]